MNIVSCIIIALISLAALDDFVEFTKFFRAAPRAAEITEAQCGKMKLLLLPINISSNQLFSNFIEKMLLSRKFYKKNLIVNFSVSTNLPHSE